MFSEEQDFKTNYILVSCPCLSRNVGTDINSFYFTSNSHIEFENIEAQLNDIAA